MALYICQGCGAEHASWAGKCPNCGTSETIRLAAGDKMVDRIIKGKFKILKKLGQGGMGAVYLAEQVGIGHKVALKFLKSEFSSDPEIARRFLNEAKSYARVAHPNAVALHDFGQDEEGNLFIAMEYCEGTDLKKVLSDSGPLSLIEAIDVVLQVADVLANAHDKGVIHRDLKPENIMIRRGIRGVHAKVLDFGIARLMDAGTKLTVAGSIAGTPRYMSPEQVQGQEVDARADIYSLGIVLFEVLTGVQPFDGSSITEILHKQVSEPIPRLTAVSSELDYPALEAVVQAACAKRRDDRYPDMLAFANALSQATPTQAHLKLPPIARTSQAARAMATPLPGGNLSGVASPGTMPDAASVDGTLVRGASQPDLQAVSGASQPRLQAQPIALTAPASATAVQAAAMTQPGSPPRDLTAPRDIGSATLGDRSAAPGEPTRAPKSNAPLYAVGAVVVLAAGGGLFLATRPTAPTTVSPPVVVTPPVQAQQPVPGQPVQAQPVEPPPKPVEVVPLDQAQQLLAQKAAAGFLKEAQAEYEKGNLDAAEITLRYISNDVTAVDQGKQLQDRIDEIRRELKTGQSLANTGHCVQAVPHFDKVLRLNSAIKAAAEGKGRCNSAAVPTTVGE